MDKNEPNCQYEVLNPWSEIDPLPLRGISLRLIELGEKTIGLFANHKEVASPILDVVKKELIDRFPALRFDLFPLHYKGSVSESENRTEFNKWLTCVDAVVAAVGD